MYVKCSTILVLYIYCTKAQSRLWIYSLPNLFFEVSMLKIYSNFEIYIIITYSHWGVQQIIKIFSV